MEVVVTLVLIAVAAALVAPVFQRSAQPAETLGPVLAMARESAAKRSQSLLLSVDAGGRWRLSAPNDTAAIATGSVVPAGALRIRVDALGACLVEDGAMAERWDAIACAPSIPAEAR